MTRSQFTQAFPINEEIKFFEKQLSVLNSISFQKEVILNLSGFEIVIEQADIPCIIGTVQIRIQNKINQLLEQLKEI